MVFLNYRAGQIAILSSPQLVLLVLKLAKLVSKNIHTDWVSFLHILKYEAKKSWGVKANIQRIKNWACWSQEHLHSFHSLALFHWLTFNFCSKKNSTVVTFNSNLKLLFRQIIYGHEPRFRMSPITWVFLYQIQLVLLVLGAGPYFVAELEFSSELQERLLGAGSAFLSSTRYLRSLKTSNDGATQTVLWRSRGIGDFPCIW